MKDHQTWACKIGIIGDIDLPGGADLPMRMAIQRAFKEITGVDAEFCFSGWNAELTPVERSVVGAKKK